MNPRSDSSTRPCCDITPDVRRLRRFAALVILVALSVFASSCVVSKNPVSGRKRALGYSWAQERQIGAEADPQIVAQFGLYDDPEMAAYVEEIGQQVLAESHLRRPDTDPEFRNTPFTFRVLDSPVVNAFALPGGYIYVTRGLMAHLENEAQLAVVLGHEVGHVAARHSSQRALQGQLAQIGLIGGAIVGQSVLGGNAGESILNLGGSAAQLLLLSYGRDAERESDRLGVEYATLVGYEAGEGSEFFRSLQRISERAGSTLPSFLSTHPDPGEREQTIKELAAEWEERVEGTSDEINQERYFDIIDGIVYGEDPRQGYVDDGMFFHPELRFQFPVPRGWQVANQPTQVVIAQPDGQAALVFTFAQANSAREAAQAFAAQQGIQVIESGPSMAGDFPAYYVLADVPQQNQTLRVLDYYIEYEGTVYRMLGLAAQQGFSSYQDAFANTMRGFSRLTDSRRINVQPVRLRTSRASRSGTFQSFLPNQLPSAVSAEELAIVNQVQLNEEIQQGHGLKLVQ